jgi:hypothetical protein
MKAKRIKEELKEKGEIWKMKSMKLI